MSNLLNFKLVGSTPRFQPVIQLIQKMIRVDATVLIEGKTGTGKELAARACNTVGMSLAPRQFGVLICG